MACEVRRFPADEPVLQVPESLDCRLVVLGWLKPGKCGMADVRGNEIRQIPVALGQPPVQLLPGFLAGADVAHRPLQLAERLPVPVQVDVEAERDSKGRWRYPTTTHIGGSGAC